MEPVVVSNVVSLLNIADSSDADFIVVVDEVDALFLSLVLESG